MKQRTCMSAALKTIEKLLIKRAIEGLTDDERLKLERLLRSESVRDDEIFERTAAAIHVGRIRPSPRLPDALRRRLEQQAIEYLASKNG